MVTKSLRLKFICALSMVLILSAVIHPLGIDPAMANPGVDGDRTFSTPGTIVLNRYSQIMAVDQGANTITVNDINDLNDGSGHYANDVLTTGDMLLIYQAQGATFNNTTTTDPDWGAYTLGDAGTYQFTIVSSVSGNVITVESSNTPPYLASGIIRNYSNAQAIRVPQYSNLTIGADVTVTANDWNGTTGGVVVLVVQNTLTINGTIDVSGQGFRGGVAENLSTPWETGPRITLYASIDPIEGAEKGESILGYQNDYDTNGNGRYGRGAPANGGGGGNAHNAGGGGGANGNLSGGTWNGSGTPDTSDPSWAPAWDIDDLVDDGAGDPLPGYFIGGAGGGRGGYTFSFYFVTTPADPLIHEPGNVIWYGDYRRQVGGLGGRPLNNNPNERVFFGGGGGAGDGNNFASSSGANGGGLIILTAATIEGSGQVLANGAEADPTFPNHYDAPGGGGGGGSIVVQTRTISGSTLAIQANGGDGGDQLIRPEDQDGVNVEAEGPGGGGGGGYIAIDVVNSSGLTTSINGGNNGTTTSEALVTFIPNGATLGYSGSTYLGDFTFPGSETPTALQLVNLTSRSSTPTLLFTLVLVSISLLTLISYGVFFANRRSRT